ncbi:MAG: Hg(II)-responsive transcriptional regulator [Candidatus Zixiibacteriota bacterium]
MTSESGMTIGALAARTKVNRETIRFYERESLMPKPDRTTGGYRVYSSSDVQRLHFIQRAKALGFTLVEIRELLGIADGRISRCTEVRAIAEDRLASIERQIEDLERLRQSLRALVKRCRTARRIEGCPIIETLSKGEQPDED